MKVAYYDEADHDEVLAMNLHAFNWPFTEATVEKYLKRDSRWMDLVAIYAVEGGRTVGQVIPLRIPSRTSEGLEAVGGIAGVTVVPDMARRGIATVLMKEAHCIFRENDIRTSFLLTAESLVAYALYLKLGYIDVLSLGGAQKFVGAPRRPKDMALRSYRKKDWGTTDKIYSRAVHRLLGFAVRQAAFLNMKIDTTPLRRNNVRLIVDDEAEGYVVESPGDGHIVIREVICPTKRAFNRMMAAVEAEAAGKHVFIPVLTSRRLQDGFEKRGYRVDSLTWSRVMVTPLVRSLTKKRLYQLYDFEDSFWMTGLDTF
ncbi:MAG: GNAT family N-acetyltransferase [Thermoplasmata archaeon]